MQKARQDSTQSSQNQPVYMSNLRLVNSEHFTPEMAVNYLYKWRTDPKYTKLVLERLYQLCRSDNMSYLPTVIFVMSLQNSSIFESFCQKMAKTSLTHYLLIRWSYSTYLDSNKKQTQSIITKLDSCILQQPLSNNSQQAIHKRAQDKFRLSNYTQHINSFFDKLFSFPQKLKKIEKQKRNQKLRQYINKAKNKFLDQKIDYINGIIFPISYQSNVAVNILTDYCFTFSTKERVPFKFVIQTLSFCDVMKLKNGQEVQYRKEEDQEDRQQPYILPHTYFGKQWRTIKQQINNKSKYGKIKSQCIKCYMVKSGDDLRQQYMAMQLISLINDIFKKQNIKIWMRPYAIIPFSDDSGLLEFIDDTRTISYLKEVSHQRSLKNIYRQIFGSNWQAATTNFIQSLAGYSLLQYFFNIKDRHNNNILVDVWGHIIHIDFSFMLSSSPGNMNFQKAPFKLTQDYMDLMEGEQSDIFKHFKLLFFLGLKYLRKYKKQIMNLILMMTECKGMKCFIKFNQTELQMKFHQNTTDEQLEKLVDSIIKDACSSYTTTQYDVYQWWTNKIQI